MCERVREREHTRPCSRPVDAFHVCCCCCCCRAQYARCMCVCVCPASAGVCTGWAVIPPGDVGAGPRGAITGPGTCPGKRPDVSGIKTTHTPCQTAGRMDGCRKNMGVIKKRAEKRIMSARVLMDEERLIDWEKKREGSETKRKGKRRRKTY